MFKTADELVDSLLAGNKRYANKEKYEQQRRATESAQHPQVIVLGCSDSRVPVSVIMDDCRLGSIFEIRTAGNAVDAADVESIFYAIKHVKPKPLLLIVLSHTRCGAIVATYDGLTDPKQRQIVSEYTTIVRNIAPSIEHVVAEVGKEEKQNNTKLTRACILERCVVHNSKRRAQELHLLIGGEVTVMSMVYNVETGIVSVCGTYPATSHSSESIRSTSISRTL